MCLRWSHLRSTRSKAWVDHDGAGFRSKGLGCLSCGWRAARGWGLPGPVCMAGAGNWEVPTPPVTSSQLLHHTDLVTGSKTSTTPRSCR